MEYSRSLLRVVVAQVCQTLGWNGIQSTPLELLTDILERYLLEIGRTSHRYSEQAGRIEPNLDDLGLTFQDIRVSIEELQDYAKHVDPVTFIAKPPNYPVPRANMLNFPPPNSKEVLQREENMEHVHNYLPVMYPELADEEEVKSASVISENVAPSTGTEENSGQQISPFSTAEKRPFQSPGESPPIKRMRTLPDEMYHSAYEMKSVSMTMSGVLTPSRGIGKLPDARTPPQSLRSVPTSVTGKPKPVEKIKMDKIKLKPPVDKVADTSHEKAERHPLVSSVKIKSKSKSSSKHKKVLTNKSGAKIKILPGGIKVKSKSHKIKLPGDKLKKVINAENVIPVDKPPDIKIKKIKDSKKFLKNKDHTKPLKLKSKSSSSSLSSSKKKSKSPKSSHLKSPGSSSKSSKHNSDDGGMSSLKTLLNQQPLKFEPPPISAPPMSDSMKLSSPVQSPPSAPPPPSPPPMVISSSPRHPDVTSSPQPSSFPDHSSPSPSVPLPVHEEEVSLEPMLIKRPASPSLPLPPRPLDDSSDSEDTPELKLIIEEEPAAESPTIKEARLSSYDNIINSVIRNSEKMLQEDRKSQIKEDEENQMKDKQEREKKEQKERQKVENKQAREASIMDAIESVIAQGQDSSSVSDAKKDVYSFDDFDGPPKSPPVTPIKPLLKSPGSEKKIKKKKIKQKGGQGDEPKNVKNKLKEKIQGKKDTPLPIVSTPDWPKVKQEKSSPVESHVFDYPSPKKLKSPVSSAYSHSASVIAEAQTPEPTEMKSDSSKKEKKKDKEKKKKNKDKDKDKEKKERKKDKEKHKKDKHREKHKHREEGGPPIPKLTLKIGGLGGTPVSTVITGEPMRHHSVKVEPKSPPHKMEIPKLVIKKPMPPTPKTSMVTQSPKSVTKSGGSKPAKSSPTKQVAPKASPKPSPPKRAASPPPRPPPSPPRPAPVPSPSPPSSPSPMPSPSPPARSPSPLTRSPSRSPTRPMFTPSPPSASTSPASPAINIPQPSPSSSSSLSPPPPRRLSPSPPPPRKRSPSPAPLSPPPAPHSLTPSPEQPPPPPKPAAVIPPPPPGSSQVLQKRTVITETEGTITDPVTGEKIWICPACKKRDDGSAMIGCDECDDWYHWPCVGIEVEPAESEQWYCPRCRVSKAKQVKKKKVRRKKKT